MKQPGNHLEQPRTANYCTTHGEYADNTYALEAFHEMVQTVIANEAKYQNHTVLPSQPFFYVAYRPSFHSRFYSVDRLHDTYGIRINCLVSPLSGGRLLHLVDD
jgi:hypothetical protein